jgi:arylsulfatase A-like enzyme
MAAGVWLIGAIACRQATVPAEPRPQIPESAVLLELGRADLADVSGNVHGGAVVSGHQSIAFTVALGPGDTVIEVLGSASDVYDEPGLLEVRVDGAKVGEVAFEPARGLHTAELRFPHDGVASRRIELHFVNDVLLEDGRDRNLDVERVRVLAPDRSAESRAAGFRAALGRGNVVLVSLDTVRADALGAYGQDLPTTPRIDRLAQSGTVFEQALSASHWTAPSHATMLTGLHPEEHGIVELPWPKAISPDVVTLAERLRAQGYQTGAFTGGFLVTRLLGFDQGFDEWTEDPRDCAPTLASTLGWIASAREPFFLFYHTYQAHQPYLPPEPFAELFLEGLPRLGAEEQARIRVGPVTGTELRAMRAAYLAEVREADRCVGEILDALPDDTLVIVTSDHGEGHMDYDGFGHGSLEPGLLHVPLVVAHPLARAVAVARVEQITGAVDVVPTVLDLLGIDATELPGRSLLPAMVGAPVAAEAWSSTVAHGGGAALRDDRGHYVVNQHGRRWYAGPVPGRFEVVPAADLAREHERVERFLAAHPLRFPPVAVPDEGGEHTRRLQALGYVD